MQSQRRKTVADKVMSIHMPGLKESASLRLLLNFQTRSSLIQKVQADNMDRLDDKPTSWTMLINEIAFIKSKSTEWNTRH